MKRQLVKKMVGLGLATVMTVSCIAGCGSNSSTNSKENSSSSNLADKASGEAAEDGKTWKDITIDDVINASVDGNLYSHQEQFTRVIEAKDTGVKATDCKIGLAIFDDDSDAYMMTYWDGLKEEIEAQGLSDVIMVTADGDASKQAEQISSLIQQGCDVIGICAVDGTMIESSIDECNEAGIPVYMMGGEPMSQSIIDKIEGYAGADIWALGAGYAYTLCSAIEGEGQVINLSGAFGSPYSDPRTEAALWVIKNYFPDIEVVADEEYNWSKEEAATVTENLLIKYPDVNGIMACNDTGALGAIVGLQEAGIDGVLVGSGNIYKEGYDAIKAGTLYSSGTMDARVEAHMAVDYAIKILEGKERTFYEYLPYTPVTSENLDEIDYPEF